MHNISSPRLDDANTEAVIQDLGIKAPRVTQSDLENNIADIEIVKHVSKSGQILRWAVITTQSGFAVTGRPSAAVNAENDRAELGEKYAKDNAINELWGYMGYALKERQHAEKVPA